MIAIGTALTGIWRHEAFAGALDAARMMRSTTLRNNPFLALVALADGLDRGTLYPAWQSLLRSLSGYRREDALLALGTCAPLLTKLGGRAAVDGSIEAALEVCEWWP
jgi:hypothetical protein